MAEEKTQITKREERDGKLVDVVYEEKTVTELTTTTKVKDLVLEVFDEEYVGTTEEHESIASTIAQRLDDQGYIIKE